MSDDQARFRFVCSVPVNQDVLVIALYRYEADRSFALQPNGWVEYHRYDLQRDPFLSVTGIDLARRPLGHWLHDAFDAHPDVDWADVLAHAIVDASFREVSDALAEVTPT